MEETILPNFPSMVCTRYIYFTTQKNQERVGGFVIENKRDHQNVNQCIEVMMDQGSSL